MSNPVLDCWEGLIIRENSLIKRNWVPPVFKDEDSDEIIKDGYYEEKEVTDRLPEFLTYNCIIEDGTTLRDFFKLLNKHKEILGIIFRRDWFVEWLSYGLKSPDNTLSKVPESDGLEIDYFEIGPYLNRDEAHIYNNDIHFEYTIFETDEKVRRKIFDKGFESEESTELHYDFGMVSKPITKKYIDQSNGAYTDKNIGERINIGFLGSDLATLMDYPLKLKTTLGYCKTYCDDQDKPKYENIEWKNFFNIRLFDIIAAIFFELSFYGDPEMMKEKAKEVFDLADKCKKELPESE